MQRFSVTMLFLILLSGNIMGQAKDRTAALNSLVEAERAFARTSVERGVRASFLAYFAAEGVNFQPHPVRISEAYSQRPATRPPITLNWAPLYADVAASGDFGYTTGPYLLTDEGPTKRAPQHGMYFSVWQKQADGQWKVVVDAGITTPAAVAALPGLAVRAAPPGAPKPVGAADNLATGRAALFALERELLQQANSVGVTKAFLAYLNDEARFHRPGRMPILGPAAVRDYLAAAVPVLTWEPLASDLAASGELGYTYGRYEVRAAGDQPPVLEKGYYVRVWKRQATAGWQIVLDTTSPLPADQK